MTEEEANLRKRIVEGIKSRYPDTTDKNFMMFLEGRIKPTIDSWLGDVFASLRIPDYENWRSVLFCD